MSTLKGKTLFITGASRGIGKAIALRAARDGANVVIAAKTAEPHPKLKGTIYTAKDEIEAAGGKALACIVDVRMEEQIKQAVDEAVRAFGGIDILVNNASAISLTGTLQTPMKRFDLMHGINTRGTFACSQACIPHLAKAENPHILNISPPLNMEARWFAPHVAYTMAKYGMSLCVLGMHEELRPRKLFQIGSVGTRYVEIGFRRPAWWWSDDAGVEKTPARLFDQGCDFVNGLRRDRIAVNNQRRVATSADGI